MVIRSALVLALVVCLTGTARAQTHPCDQPPPISSIVASGAPHKVQFCLPLADRAEALLAVVNGTPHDLVAIEAKTPASALGQVLYESVLFIQVPRGEHVLTIAAYNRNTLTGLQQLGVPSPPFPFVAVDDTPVPTAPSIRGVVR